MADKTANTPATGVTGTESAAPAAGKDTVVKEVPAEEAAIATDGEEMFAEEDSAEELDPAKGENAKTPASAKPDAKTEQNAAYAEIRRKAESDARMRASAEAQRMAQLEIDRTFAEMGLTDPYTNKPIRTKAEYDAYKTRHNKETIERELDKVGMTRETMDALIDSHPAVQQAKTAAKAYEEAKRREQDIVARTRFDEQMKQITSIDPEIKTYDDLAKQPYFEKIRGYIKGNKLSIYDAYRLANMEEIGTKKAQAAAQSAYNSTASREHLTSTTGRGQGEIPMTRQQMEWYRRMRPGMTEKQIREDYARNRIK